MTYTQTANSLRRLADAIDSVVKNCGADAETGKPVPHLTEEQAVGGAAVLCYIRDLVTCANREDWGREVFLVLLEQVSRDPEVFPLGIGETIYQADPDETV